MIDGFEEILDPNRFPFNHKYTKLNKALKLFSKWYSSLWW